MSEIKFQKSEYYKDSNTLMLNFSCVADTEDLTNVSEEEIDFCKWFSREEAKREIAPESLAERFLTNFLSKNQ